MTIEHVTDHADSGVDLLVSQFLGKPRIEGMLRAWLAQAQSIEDAIWDLLMLRVIANATAAQLDVLGEIVGQPRDGRADEHYRLWVQARTLVNRSSGLPEQVIAIVKKLVGASVHVRLADEPPAAFTIHIDDPIDGQEGVEIAKILQLAKGAGIRALLHWTNSNNTFRFAPGATSVLDSDYGFGAGQLSAVSDGRSMVVPGDNPRTLLGPSVIEYWDSRYGVTLVGGEVDGWAGQLQGSTLTAPGPTNRPAYMASDPSAGGKPSISTHAAGPRTAQIVAAADLVAAGAYAYAAFLGRLRTLQVAGSPRLRKWSLSDVAGSQCIENYVWNSVQDAGSATLTTGAAEAFAGSQTIAPVLEEIFCSASGLTYARNGTTLATNPGATGGLAAAVRRVTIGAINGVGFPGDTDFYQFVIASAAPSAAQRAAYLAYARAEWGTP